MGIVLDALKRCGLEQNTIVIFSSDNGPENTGGPDQKGVPGAWRNYYSLGETGGLRGRKRSLYEGGVRVPFIIRWPGHASAGMKNETTVLSAVDLLPTFCAAAGVTVPEDADGDGENLLYAFYGKPVHRTRPLDWRYRADSLAVRDQWWEEVLALLVNENKVGPKINPIKELYWEQFGGGPDSALLRRMDPNRAIEFSQEIAARNEIAFTKQ